ncbi:DinB family protein [Fulvivirgaceae bacterium BMA12]|uniref:DinB family protein n=1 Tax=Agaribacillus aureus TaxID=3051825 RepID=A0ABT8L0L7_9BACT|nr:DinB family protein [Fulvivirgaceae bacterium BMA12]
MKHWISQIDQTTDAFQKHFGALSVEELNWKPNPETWSIAQNIDHLIVINSTYFPVISNLKSGNYKLPFMAKFGFMVSFFGKTILNASKPDRKKKMKTFPIWEPAKSYISPDILARFSKHQSELKQAIEASEDLIKIGSIISSPANKNIVYKLETAFDIIVVHEQRHLEQSKDVLSLLGKMATAN